MALQDGPVEVWIVKSSLLLNLGTNRLCVFKEPQCPLGAVKGHTFIPWFKTGIVIVNIFTGRILKFKSKWGMVKTALDY